MNKKLFLGMIATTGLLFATSCSSEDLIETTSGENVNVSFTVNTDSSVGSRAVADGMTAKKLYFAVFDSITGYAHQLGNENMENGVANIKLTLAKNNTYSIAFWAQAEDAPYTFDDFTGKVKINYEGANNAENRDAFYANRKFTVKGDINETVTLYRPFAQINVGTTIDDYNNVFPTYDYVKSSVILNGEFGTEFNVLTGEVTATTSTPINYQVADAPTAADNNLRVANKDYEYISTCYVLPASSTESQTVKAEFKFDLSPMMSVELSQGLDMLPIQSNYRTNIVGDILTANAEWNVVIDNDFDGEYNNIAESDEPAVSADGTTYYVSTPAQWNWMVAKGELSKNVTLMADLDFDGDEVAPLYPNVNNFVFDGNGKTIKKAKYVFKPNMSPHQIGLFSLETYSGTEATFKNVTIEEATVNNTYDKEYKGNVYGYAGALIGDVQNNTTVTIEGVTVQNSTIKGTQSVGSLIGFLASNAIVNVKNTTVKENALTNYDVANESGYVCGLVGRVVGRLNIQENVVVEGNTIDAYFATRRGPKSIDAVAAVSGNGKIAGTATVSGNTVTKSVFEDYVVAISNKTELLAFAANYSDYNNQTVVLTNDIDLEGANWTPVGRPDNVQFGQYKGTFDGGNYTIKNVNIKESEFGATVAEAIAFFGWIQGATIKNINFDGVEVEGHHYVSVVAGYVTESTIENCTIRNANLKAIYKDAERSGDKAGFIAAYVNAGNATSIDNITVHYSNIEAVRDAGIIVGSCTAHNVTIGRVEYGVGNVSVKYIGEALAAPTSDADNYSKNGDNIKNELIGRE